MAFEYIPAACLAFPPYSAVAAALFLIGTLRPWMSLAFVNWAAYAFFALLIACQLSRDLSG
eukprot:6963687-Lingulodinium_polyedra.AAC.1